MPALARELLQLMKIRQQILFAEAGQKLCLRGGVQTPNSLYHFSFGHGFALRALHDGADLRVGQTAGTPARTGNRYRPGQEKALTQVRSYICAC